MTLFAIIVFIILALIFGLVVFFDIRKAKKQQQKYHLGRSITAMCLIFPACLLAFFFILLPILYSLGYGFTDYNLLKAIIEKFNGGPVGIEAIATTIGEDPGTVEEVYEPYLVQNGLILRTPRGRIVSEEAYLHFGLTMPKP